MEILVCVKHVPATDTRVKVGADGKSLDRADVTFIPNPFDEFAVEEALKWKEAGAATSVTVVAVGGEGTDKTLKHCLAMGADAAVHVDTAPVNEPDPGACAALLAQVAKERNPGAVFAGKQAVGGDHGLVPGMLAERLGWGSACVVTKIERDGNGVVCHREVEGGEESVAMTLPAVIACQKGLNEPRYPSLKGIMAAKKKTVDVKKAADLGVDPAAPGLVVLSMAPPPARAEGRMIAGEPAAQAAELARLLREEAKVI